MEDDNEDLFLGCSDENFECNDYLDEEEKKSFEYLSFIIKIRNFAKKTFSKRQLVNSNNEEEPNIPDKVDKGRRKVIQYDFTNRCPINNNDD